MFAFYQMRHDQAKLCIGLDRSKAMVGRKSCLALAAAAALLATGCAAGPDPSPSQQTDKAQNVEFLRGCWVTKEQPGGPAAAFLRLLPEGADGPEYKGTIQLVRNPNAPFTMYVAFARDGSWMRVDRSQGGPIFPLDDTGNYAQRPAASLPDGIAAKLPKAQHRATYAIYGGLPTTPWITAEGDEHNIHIYLLGNGGQVMGDVFSGERDGCD